MSRDGGLRAGNLYMRSGITLRYCFCSWRAASSTMRTASAILSMWASIGEAPTIVHAARATRLLRLVGLASMAGIARDGAQNGLARAATLTWCRAPPMMADIAIVKGLAGSTTAETPVPVERYRTLLCVAAMARRGPVAMRPTLSDSQGAMGPRMLQKGQYYLV
jgi:hypothetical protein